MKRYLYLQILLFAAAAPLVAEPIIRFSQTEGALRIAGKGYAASIIYDEKDAPVVETVAKALAKDIHLITGETPALNQPTDTVIIIGSIDQSDHIQSLVNAGKLNVSDLGDAWERFQITAVENPMDQVSRALVIAGSDPRGAAYGAFEVSRQMGVSPWVWWADVKPEKQTSLYASPATVLSKSPSVKYRGVFLNDEDWGLKPWAATNLDTDVKNIGPNTYARIFELLLRLRANAIWPAMHPCTKAFYHYSDNPKVANQYAILIGSSHCEPMLRNNVDEWKRNFQKEYGKRPGDWNYETNRDEVKRYWEDRVREAAQLEAIYTVGMRGIHDGHMPGGKTLEDKLRLMDEVLRDQRDMLNKWNPLPADRVPQIFCPYKEVLELYNAGLKLPEDITLMWADDNHGYIRQLSTPAEQKRSGRSGVYYHLSYWGTPQDYLWLSSISPSLISYEMTKAFDYGADRLWIFNVGDLKPAEMELEFAMDLAWDVDRWAPARAHTYPREWAARTFGAAFAEEIGAIKSQYYHLAASGKPEHMNQNMFHESAMIERLEAYSKLTKAVLLLETKIPARLQDAYFQLIMYPVMGAANMNEKLLRYKLGEHDRSMAAYNEIQRLTKHYNQGVAGGKWNGMMRINPRNQPIFGKPSESMFDKQRGPKTGTSFTAPVKPFEAIAADTFTKKSPELKLVPGLGVGGVSLSPASFTMPTVADNEAPTAPYAEYKISFPEEGGSLNVVCVPTHRIHEGRGLRLAVSVAGKTQIVNLHSPSKSKEWKNNVCQGYSQKAVSIEGATGQESTIRIGFLDAGIALTELRVYK